MKRLALYMLFDEAGVVEDYVLYKLSELRKHVDTIVVVSNGPLNAAGKQALADVADIVHERANNGFDVWAYREGLLEVIGWRDLADYDELLLINYTFYGPIFPFAEMFDRMDKDPVDFWGITAFKGPVDNGTMVIPYHLQSHFIAVRKRLVSSPDFRNYWESMPAIASYNESIQLHEARFTEHFAERGFSHSVYVDPLRYNVANPVFDAVDQMLEDRCPILKRRPFFHDPLYLDHHNVELGQALAIIENSSTYDTSLIWKDITRVARPRDLYTNAALFDILPTLVRRVSRCRHLGASRSWPTSTTPSCSARCSRMRRTFLCRSTCSSLLRILKSNGPSSKSFVPSTCPR